MLAPAEMSRGDIVALDRRYVWHPYTSSRDHESRDPLVVVRAQGVWLEDADGRRYLDGNGSWWVSALGHGHPRLVRALEAQAKELAHCAIAGITHAPATLLAKELVSVAPPGLTRVFFSDDGSTAVEVAAKMAIQYWHQNGRPARRRFVALGGAFHGDTVGAVSLGGIAAFRSVFGPLLFDVLRAPDPETGSSGWDRCVETIEALLRSASDAIAAVVVEPLLQGAAGMRTWPAELLARIREATTRADTFLIADEVFTGYGRTGTMWACDQAGVVPDLLCVAKAFSGGMLPMAATLATERIYDGFRGDKDRALMHGHSFAGNPLGAAVAREVLGVYRDEDIVGQVRQKAPLVARGFARIAELRGVERARSIGLVGAADLGEGGYHGELGWRVFDRARERGAYLRPLGDTVYIAPALNISEAELEQLLGIVYEAVREVVC